MTIGDTFVAAFNRDFFSSAFGNIAINKVSGEVELFRQIKRGYVRGNAFSRDVQRASVAVVNSEMIDGCRSGVGTTRVQSPAQLVATDGRRNRITIVDSGFHFAAFLVVVPSRHAEVF